MDSHKFKKINWLNVITHNEFQKFLDNTLVKEISLASKVVREKLMPLVFKKVKISNSNLSYSSNSLFASHYKYFYTGKLDYSDFKDSLNHSIDTVITDLTIELSDIKKFVKSLHFCDITRPGIYIFPIISTFGNLTRLELGYNIMIPYSGFIKLGESLHSLTQIKISADLLKLPNENFLPEDYIFPINLKYLEIIDTNIVTTSSISDPYSFLFNRDNSETTIDYFTLPKILISSLTELVFYGSTNIDQGLKAFLEINSNLESLSIRSTNLKSIEALSSLKNLKLDGNIRFDTSDQALALKSLKYIHITSVVTNDWDDVKRLCSICINLELIGLKVRYSITDSQQFIDNKLAPTVINLSHLKKLQLYISVGDNTNLNLTKLSNVEVLVLTTQDKVIFNLDFINCEKLKKIVLKSNNYVINTKEFKVKFNKYKNWTFKFEKLIIKGYKINQ